MDGVKTFHMKSQLSQHFLFNSLFSLSCNATAIINQIPTYAWICFWPLCSFYWSLCLAWHQYHIVLITMLSNKSWYLLGVYSFSELSHLLVVLCSSIWILESVCLALWKILLGYLLGFHWIVRLVCIYLSSWRGGFPSLNLIHLSIYSFYSL